MWSRQLADDPRAEAASGGGRGALTPEVLGLFLPALYSFVLRRTTAREDAEDLLVEVLLRASADLDRSGKHSVQLADLLRHAHQAAAVEVEQDQPLLAAGLQPGPVVPDVLPESMRRILSELPPLQRYVLAMRLGDGLSIDDIALILGQLPERLLDPMAAAVEALLPVRQRGPVDPMVLCSYTEAVLAGRSRSPSALPEPAQQVARAIAATRVPVEPTDAEVQRVWHRYEQEREEFLPGTVMPVLPAWARSLLLSLLLLVGLVIVSLWWLSRPADEPRLMAAPAPTTQPAEARSEPSRGRPAQRGQLPQLVAGAAGRLFVLVHGPGDAVSLQMLDLSKRQPDGVPTDRTLLTVPGGPLPFALSPSGLRVAYGREDGVWMQDVDGGYTRLVATLGAVQKPIAGNNVVRRCEGSRAGPLAWRPDSTAIVAVWEQSCLGGAPEVHLLSTAGWPTKVLIRLEMQEKVSALSWSPDGRYLLITSNYGVAALDTAGGNRLRRYPPQITSAEWMPDVERDVLLWRRTGEGGKPVWGTAAAGEAAESEIGPADFAAWSPDGAGVILADLDAGGRYAVSRVTPGSRDREALGTRPFPGTQLPRLVRLSPDAKFAAYTTQDSVYLLDYERGVQQKLPVSGARPAELVWLPPVQEVHPAVAPDYRASGTILYMEPLGSIARQDRRLVAVSAATGGGVELVRGRSLTYSPSPMGDAVAYSTGCRLTVLDLMTGNSRQASCPNGSEVLSIGWAPDASSLVYVSQRPGAARSGPAGAGTPPTDVWKLDLLTGDQRRVIGGSSLFSPRSVSYSASGRWLLVTDGERWRLLAADGSGMVGLPASASQYSWAPDAASDRLLAVGPGAEVLRVQGRNVRSIWRARPKTAAAEGVWLDPHQFALITGERGRLIIGNDATRTLSERKVQGSAPSPGLGSPGPRFSSGLTASPNVRWLAFGGADGLFTLEPPGGQSRLLVAADFGALSPSWISYSGPMQWDGVELQLPASQRGRRSALLLVEADGGKYNPLWLYDQQTGSRTKLADVSGFDVRPDGRQVVYTDSVGVWQLDLATDEERPLTDLQAAGLDAGAYLHSPRWSHNGKYVSYIADLPPGAKSKSARSQVRLINIELEQDQIYQEIESNGTADYLVDAEWSGDDASMLIETRSSASMFGIVPVGRQFLLNYSEVGSASLSPQPGDGSVLYTQHPAPATRGEVLVRTPDGVVRSLTQDGWGELWAPDGSSVYYFQGGGLWQSSRDGSYTRLAAASVPYSETASAPVWSDPGQLTYVSGRLVLDLDLASGKVKSLLTWPSPVGAVMRAQAPGGTDTSAP